MTLMNTSDFFEITLEKLASGNLDIKSYLDIQQLLLNENKLFIAIELYNAWLRYNSNNPFNYVIFFNLGTLYQQLGLLEEAQKAYKQAIELNPNFFQARYNLALTFERQGKINDAINELLYINNNIDASSQENRQILILALNNLGRILEDQKNLIDAYHFLSKSLSLDGNQPEVIHHWVFLREKLCIWPIYPQMPNITQEMLESSTSALAMLAITDDPQIQLNTAKNFVLNKIPTNIQPIDIKAKLPYKHKRIRIGYCSSDFCLHPVAMLTVGILENHNKEEFEVFIYDWTTQPTSYLRERIIKAAEHYIPIHNLSDYDAAKLISEHEIDILIDLHGQTLGARPIIFAYRPAPIQITYLGLPATTGFPFIDYIIADNFLIPEEYKCFYSEKVLYMPEIYQVGDTKRVIQTKPSRESFGLPKDAFVYCCLNNNNKFTPKMLDVWANILHQTNNTVLWLLADNYWTQQNLIQEAIKRNIDINRLYFTYRSSPEQYLQKYMVADLFLDTFPFNAGTTANDALWMELPVITICGRAFAARMAATLLKSVGLEELICYSFEEYEKKAIHLSQNLQKYKEIKITLKQAKSTSPLFDEKKFVKNLELKLKELIEDLNKLSNSVI